MPARFDIVTIDAVDTRALAEFWCAALDLHIAEDEDDGRWLLLCATDGTRILGLQRTSDESHAGRSAGRMHVDLACAVTEFDSERTRLLALGATETRPPRTEPYGRIANLADPAGTLFDLCAYHN